MRRDELKMKRKLLEKMPYEKHQLNDLGIRELKMLASVLGINSWQKSKDQLVKVIYKNQHELDLIDERMEDFCEMCGNFVAIRQDSHIVSEKGRARINILKLCPSCHVMFDTRLKPRLYEALKDAGAKNLPKSWTKTIYHQAIEAALKARRKKLKA
jgi:hypothetical protein